MAVQPVRYRFTVDEYHQMAQAGIFTEHSPVELIDGAIVEMPAHGGWHIRCVTLLNRLLVAAVGTDLLVSPQNSVRLNLYSEPDPDFAILRVLPQGSTPPPTEDVLLVIEVADTSLLYDLNAKASLYARAGVPELWVIDLNSPRVLQHTDPREDRYTHVNEFYSEVQITSATTRAITIAVADIFARPEQPRFRQRNQGSLSSKEWNSPSNRSKNAGLRVGSACRSTQLATINR